MRVPVAEVDGSACAGGELHSPDRVEGYLTAEDALYAAFTTKQQHSSQGHS